MPVINKRKQGNLHSPFLDENNRPSAKVGEGKISLFNIQYTTIKCFTFFGCEECSRVPKRLQRNSPWHMCCYGALACSQTQIDSLFKKKKKVC